MDEIDYIPLGSVVLLKSGMQKLLVIARGINVNNGGETYFFDYGGVLYPEGLTGDQMVYFNHDSIAKVVFEGLKDDDNTIMIENINAYIKKHPDLKRGDPSNWRLAE